MLPLAADNDTDGADGPVVSTLTVVLMLIVFPGAVWWAYVIIPLWNFVMVVPGGVLGYWFFNSVRRSGVLE